MSHGGLNILGKKSWNVWNRDNREKVKRDEEAFAQKEEKKKRRLEEIEQEKRFQHLKNRVAEVKRQNTDLGYDERVAIQNSSTTEDKSKHINFFEESELESKVSFSNPEAEAEQKAKEENDLKKIGALMYLDQDSQSKPWYQKPVAPNEARQKRDEKRKQSEDPMRDMNRFLAQTPTATPTFVPPSRPKKPLPAPAQPETTIEKLRRERLEREKKERERAQHLVAGTQPAQPSSLNETSRPYNNQFSHFTNAKSRR